MTTVGVKGLSKH